MAELLDLSFMEQEFYNKIKELQSDSIFQQKYKELETLFLQHSREKSLYRRGYSDNTGRFNLNIIGEEAFENYREFKGFKNTQKEKQLEIEIYHKTSELIDLFLKRDQSIPYAFYFSINGKIFRAFEQTISDKYLNVGTEISLAKAQTFINKVLNKNKNKIDITNHYRAFLQTFKDTYTGKSSIPNKKINEGHISEAFERHLQNSHKALLEGKSNEKLPNSYDWTVTEAWNYLKQSLGNDPWYTGGDVGNIQVKSLGMGEKTNSIQFSSMSTVLDLINFMRYIMNNDNSENALRKKAKAAYNVFKNEASDTIQESAMQAVEEIIQEMIQRIKD